MHPAIDARLRHFVSGHRRSFDRADDIDEAVVELECVHVTEHDEVVVGPRHHEIGEIFCLQPPLLTHSRAQRQPGAADRRRAVHVDEGTQVIEDHRHGRAAVPHARFEHEGRAVVQQIGLAGELERVACVHLEGVQHLDTGIINEVADVLLEAFNSPLPSSRYAS